MAWTTPSSPNLPDFLQFIQNSMMIPPAALLTSLAPPAQPVLTASGSGGSLPSGTVYVKTTYVSVFGETTPSAEASVAVTGPDGQVSVASPAAVQQGVVPSYNVYAASATGAEVLQNTTPVAIGTPLAITSLAAGTAAPPAENTAASPWPQYALNRALDLVVMVPGVAGLEYTVATYMCAAHILMQITPDQPNQSYFGKAREKLDLLEPISGVVQASTDEGTSVSLLVPESLKNLTIGDLEFTRTPWGRQYLAYAQDFGAICGLS